MIWTFLDAMMNFISRTWVALIIIASCVVGWIVVEKYQTMRDRLIAYEQMADQFPECETIVRRHNRQAWLEAGVVNGLRVYVVMEEAKR